MLLPTSLLGRGGFRCALSDLGDAMLVLQKHTIVERDCTKTTSWQKNEASNSCRETCARPAQVAVQMPLPHLSKGWASQPLGGYLGLLFRSEDDVISQRRRGE